MNIETIRNTLKNTIQGKEYFLQQYQGPDVVSQFLEVNINELKRILADVESAISKQPRVLVVVSGGVADPIHDNGVDIEVFDWDNYNADPQNTEGVSFHFADLAEQCNIPVKTA